MPNTILKRWNGSSFEELYPKTTVGQISATGSPGSTTALFGDASWKTTPSGSGSSNQIAYWTSTTTVGALTTASYPSLTELSYVKGVTSAIQTQLNNRSEVYTKYNATATNASSTTPVLVASLSLAAGAYYQINVVGMWSKASTSGSASPVISINVDDTQGTPTFNGRWESLVTSSSTTDAVSNINGSITTTHKPYTVGTATLSAVTTTPWGLRGLFYSGTTTSKLFRIYVYQSTAVSGNVTCDSVAITATKLAA